QRLNHATINQYGQSGYQRQQQRHRKFEQPLKGGQRVVRLVKKVIKCQALAVNESVTQVQQVLGLLLHFFVAGRKRADFCLEPPVAGIEQIRAHVQIIVVSAPHLLKKLAFHGRDGVGPVGFEPLGQISHVAEEQVIVGGFTMKTVAEQGVVQPLDV